MDVITALPEVDHEVVLGAESDLLAARHQLAPAAVHLEPTLVRRPDPVADLTALLRLTRRIRRGGYDVVYTHQSKAGAVGRAAAQLGGRPACVHSLSMANFGPGYGRLEDHLFRLIERWLARHTAAYAVVGRDLARRFEEVGIAPSRLHIVRSDARLPEHPVDRAAARDGLCERLDIANDRPLLLALGSLEARKGVMALPELLGEVSARTSRRPVLVVAGDGPLAGPLQQLIEALGLADDVRLIGHVSPVDEVVAAADVMVLLSVAEGLPQVLVQAAAAGRPFVAYDVDGVTELLELGASGSAVPLGDVESAAAATVALVEAAEDPYADTDRLRDALASWTREAIITGHRRIFAEVTAGGSTGAETYVAARSDGGRPEDGRRARSASGAG